MKFACYLTITILFSSICFAERMSGQSIKEVFVDISLNDVAPKKVITELQKQTRYSFFYNEKDLKDLTNVSIQAKDLSVFDVLSSLSSQSGLSFKQFNNLIAIKLEKQVDNQEQDNNKITGKITDKNTSEALIGASIVIKGTTKGTITDENGNFTISASANDILIVSYLGYQIQEIPVNNQTIINIQLATETTSLDEVVVTALGIDKETKSLGYSVQEIKGEEFEKSDDLNIVNAMVGKVAGMEISAATELLMNSDIKLRGASPLIVVDGVPINVETWDLNFNDIENISVLKGAPASALYGSSGANGAILITLKKGKVNKTNVEVTTTNLIQPWLLTYPKTQTEFGTGNNGQYEYVDGTGSGIEGGGFTWGPKLDGRLIVQWNSPIDPVTGERIPIPWEDKTNGKGNLIKYLETGFVTTNNINIETGNDRGSYRISLSHSFQDGIVPNTKLNISGFSVGGTYMLSDRLEVNTSLNYSKQYSPNYRIPSYGPHDYFYSLAFWLGPDIGLDDAKNYWEPGKEGIQQRFQQLGYYNNPYFLAYENLHTWDKDVVYGQITGNYTLIPDQMKLMVRIGANTNVFEKSETIPKSMTYYGVKSKGDYIIENTKNFTINNDAILTYDKFISDNFSINVILGASYYYDKEEYLKSSTSGLSVPELYTMSNTMNPGSNSNYLLESQKQSVYANLNLKIWKPFYLSLTGRNDWVSTLPVDNNSFFYPSVSLSTVVSDMVELPSLISFLKLRTSYASVNSGWTGSTYGHIPIYTISSYNNMPTMSVPVELVPTDLYPSASRTVEVGGSVAILKNRIEADFTYFNRLDYDNIISTSVSVSSGQSSILDNAREYVRKGYELVLSFVPVKSNNIFWKINLNWSTNHQYLKSLEDGKERDGYIKINERTDQIYSLHWLTNPEGKLIIDENTGLNVLDEYYRFTGYYDPDFIYGIQNNISYKSLILSFSIDGRKGGKYLSILPRMGRGGTYTDYDNKLREDAANGLRNYVADGVVVIDGEVEYDWEGNIISDTRQYASNTTATSYQDYEKNYPCC